MSREGNACLGEATESSTVAGKQQFHTTVRACGQLPTVRGAMVAHGCPNVCKQAPRLFLLGPMLLQRQKFRVGECV